MDRVDVARWIVGASILGLLGACGIERPQVVTFGSPNGELLASVVIDSLGRAMFGLSDGTAEKFYVVGSRLGYVASDHVMDAGLALADTHEELDGRVTYTLASGKQRAVDKPYVSRVIRFTDAGTEQEDRGAVEFRLFDDGLAFRYRVPARDSATVLRELTSVVLPKGLAAVRQDYAPVAHTSPAYEMYWDVLPADAPDTAGRGHAFPLYAYDDERHVLLHEGPVTGDYFGAHLSKLGGGAYGIRGPLPEEALGLHDTVAVTSGRTTPWRLIAAGPTRQSVLATTLPTDVADEPSGDFSWVRPGRATWSWWSDWDSPRDYAKLKRFVDWSADNGWPYTLVDANWGEMAGGTLEDLAAYAKTRDVGLLVWYNSGGPHNAVTEQPRDIMHDAKARRAEMARLQSLGVKGIKVDFFQSDKPAILRQYVDILEDAAAHKLLVNFHGCTVPRGLRRTYPNLVTYEAVSGAENYEYNPGYPARAPAQHTLLPLTRNAIGPMDYTPVTFTDRQFPRLTTDAHELALAVLFESGVQHFADDIGAYDALPGFAKAYLTEVPVTWDEVRYVDGVPGEWLVLARRKGTRWYVAGVNGTDAPLELSVSLPSIAPALGSVSLLLDGATALPDGTLAGEPGALATANADDGISLELLPYGGFVAFSQ